MSSRILLAKYVPDMARMEPRNLGVFLWNNGWLGARFLDVRDAEFVNEPDTYRRWVDFWRSFVESQSVRPRRGNPVSVKDQACIEALLSTQDGNYMLVDAGDMLERVGRRDGPRALDSLYRRLVANPKSTEDTSGKSFRRICDDLFHQANLTDRSDFRRKYPVVCGLFQEKRSIHFSYGFGKDEPLALFQRVNLASEVSINNAAFTLHQVADQSIVPASSCAALIQGHQITSRIAESGRRWLEKVCQVVDVDLANASSEVVAIVPGMQLHV